ncbi:hypothetical protein Bbelb_142470 [Branchiostoma belcheri]|nr:hypothetical protein Bbelb_142470 [Branchiostoma belcheri]
MAVKAEILILNSMTGRETETVHCASLFSSRKLLGGLADRFYLRPPLHLVALCLCSLCDLKSVGARRERRESAEVAMFYININVGAVARSHGALFTLSRRSPSSIRAVTAFSRRSHGDGMTRFLTIAEVTVLMVLS